MTATLTVAALTERGLGERRVALVPDTVTRLVAGGFEVLIEAGAGAGAFHPDDEYVAAGAKTDTLESVLESADVLLAVRRPEPEILALLRPGQVLVGLLDAREAYSSGRLVKEGGPEAMDRYFHQVSRERRARPKSAPRAPRREGARPAPRSTT